MTHPDIGDTEAAHTAYMRQAMTSPTPAVGKKFDGGKLRWNLFPFDALREVGHVLMWGAYGVPQQDGTKGYGPDNWLLVEDARNRYFNATLRHLTAWFEGERHDPESGRHHLGHACCCVLFLLAMDLRGKLK